MNNILSTMVLLKSLASFCFLATVAFAVPAQEKRVHHQAHLSDHVHDDDHGYQYDHEAFLGKEDAKTFDQLTPEESKERLAKIVDRIDTDKDGYISHSELHYWIKHRQRRYIEDNVNKHWKDYDSNHDNKIAWEEYKNTTYGYYLDEDFSDVEDKDTYKTMLIRDERRFKTADRDGDGIATREEFTAFLHPEEFDYMKDLVVQETVEDIDKNGDGKINLVEYIGDMYTPENGESEPDWVQTERKHFSEIRDGNKDGYLDTNEVAQWILPGDVDHADNEAKHLIHETDTDKAHHSGPFVCMLIWYSFLCWQPSLISTRLGTSTARLGTGMGCWAFSVLPRDTSTCGQEECAASIQPYSW